MIFHSLVLYAGRKIFIKTEILCYIFAFHTYNIYITGKPAAKTGKTGDGKFMICPVRNWMMTCPDKIKKKERRSYSDEIVSAHLTYMFVYVFS